MTLTIVAGANGSGKTTFAMSYSSMCGVVFVNAEEIAKNLNPLDMESQKFHAGRIFLEEIKSLLLSQQNMMIETTMSGKYLIRVIENAKELGYKIVIFYLYLENVQNNIARVQNRVLNGGHNIPQRDIERRYIRSRDLFVNNYQKMADEWFLFFNADDEFEEVANYCDGEVTILREDYYHNFLKGIK